MYPKQVRWQSGNYITLASASRRDAIKVIMSECDVTKFDPSLLGCSNIDGCTIEGKVKIKSRVHAFV